MKWKKFPYVPLFVHLILNFLKCCVEMKDKPNQQTIQQQQQKTEKYISKTKHEIIS